MKNLRAFDILGNVAVVKFPKDFKLKEKKKFASKILKENKSVKTVLEKTGKIKGRLRKPTTKWLAGEKTKEVLYKENNCVFRFNIDKTYFSPRLSNERKEITSKVKKDAEVLVMFAGVAPFSIVIAKNSKAKKVVSLEINREANKYANLNVELNKLKDKVEIVQGDVKKVVEKWKNYNLSSLRSELIAPNQTSPRFSAEKAINSKTFLSQKLQQTANFSLLKSKKSDERSERAIPKKFDVIVMPRPQLKDTFLKQAFMLSKKGTRIYYYDFCKVGEEELIVEKIRKEAKESKKKIKILKVKIAGEIAPYKFRIRVDLEILQ